METSRRIRWWTKMNHTGKKGDSKENARNGNTMIDTITVDSKGGWEPTSRVSARKNDGEDPERHYIMLEAGHHGTLVGR